MYEEAHSSMGILKSFKARVTISEWPGVTTSRAPLYEHLTHEFLSSYDIDKRDETLGINFWVANEDKFIGFEEIHEVLECKRVRSIPVRFKEEEF